MLSNTFVWEARPKTVSLRAFVYRGVASDRSRRLLPLTADDVVHSVILPEQRTIEHRDPSELPPARIPQNTPPRTVQDPQLDTPEWRLSLDEALRISLENAKVIRVLAGTAATTSGQTIYEAAITNTTIDQARATFDPVLAQKSTFTHSDNPTAFADPLSPARA